MSNQVPSISIITPSLNQGKFIEKMLESVISQCYPSLEILVFDGGSSDETLSVLKKYGDSIQWVSRKDKGQVHAINQGLRKASGSVLAYLNADDILLPGSLTRVGKEFSSHPDMSWLTGRCVVIDERGQRIRNFISAYKNFLLLLNNRNILYITNFISQPATFWRREIFNNAGYLDEHLNYVMDYEYWLRLWNLTSPRILHQELAGFRIHQKSKTTSKGHQNAYIKEEEFVIARYTNSPLLKRLHILHRKLMTAFYTIINSSKQ